MKTFDQSVKVFPYSVFHPNHFFVFLHWIIRDKETSRWQALVEKRTGQADVLSSTGELFSTASTTISLPNPALSRSAVHPNLLSLESPGESTGSTLQVLLPLGSPASRKHPVFSMACPGFILHQLKDVIQDSQVAHLSVSQFLIWKLEVILSAHDSWHAVVIPGRIHLLRTQVPKPRSSHCPT